MSNKQEPSRRNAVMAIAGLGGLPAMAAGKLPNSTMNPDRATVTREDFGELRVYFDGREIEVGGEPMPLPRRERRILECLVRNRGRRLTKTQIFNAVYGIFDENVDENVVESHISKLRKKLKHRLGYDPVDSKRYLGYCLKTSATDE